MPLLSAGLIVGWSYFQKDNTKDAGFRKLNPPAAASARHYQPKQPEPMPLVAIMAMMITGMQQIDLGLYNENYGLIAKSAGRIADHPPIKKGDLRLIKKTLGKQMKTFQQFDMQVHHHADSMRMAAQQEDMAEILRHYSIVQHGCVSCHTHFRNRIIDAKK